MRVLDEIGLRVRDLSLLSGVSKESIAMVMGILRKKGIAVVASCGEDTIRSLRDVLERPAGELFRGLEPHPGGWRASVRKPDTLPHYPVVLHRGGFPDGS